MAPRRCTAETARGIALSLPEASERDHHGFPSYRVGGRIFATQPDEDHLNVMLDEDDVRATVREHPASCEEQWWGKRLVAVRVSLAGANERVLRQLLFDAWERLQPDR